MVQFHVYEDLTDVPLKKDAWNELVRRSMPSGVFLEHSWIHAWWQYFGGRQSLYFVTAEVHGHVLAFAPLMIDEEKTLRFIGDTNADYLGFVIPPDQIELLSGFLKFLRDHSSRWRVIHLRNIPRNSMAEEMLPDTARRVRLFPWRNYSVAAPYLQIRDNDDKVHALLNKYSNRRPLHQLKGQGKVEFVVFKTSDQAAQYWTTFAQQHIDRSRQKDRFSPFTNPDYLGFLRTLFDTDESKKRVHFSALFLNDRPVAFHFGFLSNGRLLWYKPSMDTNVRRGSPGIVLIRHLIEFTQRENRDEIDFTIGEEPFKDRFCSQKRIVDSFRIHKNRTRYLVDVGYWALRNRIKKMVTR